MAVDILSLIAVIMLGYASYTLWSYDRVFAITAAGVGLLIFIALGARYTDKWYYHAEVETTVAPAPKR